MVVASSENLLKFEKTEKFLPITVPNKIKKMLKLVGSKYPRSPTIRLEFSSQQNESEGNLKAFILILVSLLGCRPYHR